MDLRLALQLDRHSQCGLLDRHHHHRGPPHAHLGQRYDSNFLRIWTCIGCTIFYILLIVSQYKGAIALFSTLFGMDKTVIIVAFSLFAIILVNIGGFKSVAWTDFLQGILMVIIAVVIFIAAFKAVGWSFADVNTQLSAIDPNCLFRWWPIPTAPSA